MGARRAFGCRVDAWFSTFTLLLRTRAPVVIRKLPFDLLPRRTGSFWCSWRAIWGRVNTAFCLEEFCRPWGMFRFSILESMVGSDSDCIGVGRKGLAETCLST